MRNRAKCKLCLGVIESFHSTDYVTCKCDAIAVDGGDAMRCYAKDWNDFVRVDDENNEIVVTVKDKLTEASEKEGQENHKEGHDERKEKPHTKDIIAIIDNMIKDVEKLPQHAMNQPLTHYDYLSLLMLLSAAFKANINDI